MNWKTHDPEGWAGLEIPGKDASASLPTGDIAEEPERHAFTIVGESALFLVHMTMFMMEEHAYQFILHIRLAEAATRLLSELRRANSRTTFFLGNTAADLLTVPELQTAQRRSFRADIFCGIPWSHTYEFWPWRGIRPAIRDVPVAVERVVYFRKLDLNLNRPLTPTYLMFGQDNEAHLHNLQIKPPEYDHVVSLSRRPEWIDSTRLDAGMPVSFPTLSAAPDGWRVPCKDPLPPGGYLVKYRGLPELRVVEVDRTWWFSTKVVNPENPCAACDPEPSLEIP